MGGWTLDDALEAAQALFLAYWVLAAGAAAAALAPLRGARRFRAAVLLAAARGKLVDDARPSRALGPLSGWTVPQRWFWHFYALGLAWNSALLLLAAAALAPGAPRGGAPAADAATAAALLLLLLELHLARRLAETLGLLRYPPGARMHGLAYVFSLSYYLVLPPTLLPPAATRALAACAARGGACLAAAPGPARALARLGALAARATPLQRAGAALFLAANALQLHSHALLAALGRGGGRGAPYRIPRGGAFELVSCPHYAAEVLIYVGLLAAAGPARPAPAAALAWVAANLALAARLTHEWYRRAFPRYPRRRAALVPLLF